MHIRKLVRRLGMTAVIAGVALTALAAPSAAAPSAGAAKGSADLRLSVVDPTTGEEVFNGTFGWGGGMSGLTAPARGGSGNSVGRLTCQIPVRATGESVNCNPPAPPRPAPTPPPPAPTPTPTPTDPPPQSPVQVTCTTTYLTYQIFRGASIFQAEYVFVNWNFVYNWCYDGTYVRSMSASNQITYVDPTFRVNGTNTHTEGTPPATVLRVNDVGKEFVYCPITGTGGANCLAAFHPSIDVYFNGNGTVNNLSSI